MRRCLSAASISILLSLAVAEAVLAAPADLDPSFGSNGLVATRFGSDPSYPFGRAVAIQPDGRIVVGGEAIVVDALGDELVGGAVVRYNSDGSVDRAVITGVTGSEGGDLHEWQPSAVVVHGNGIVVVGEGTFGNRFLNDSGAVLVRFDANGAIDRNFARYPLLQFDAQKVYPGNLFVDDFGNVLRAGMVVVGDFCSGGLKAQSDGKLVVGCASGLARLHPDGKPDLSFNESGRASAPGISDGPGAFAIQSDGKIVVAGSSNAANFTVARVTTDGQPDTSFGGGDGFVSSELGLRVCDPSLPPGFCEPAGGAQSVMIQPDGKIVVAGTALVDLAGFGRYGLGLARYNADGALDASFGVNGTVITDFGDWTEARAAVLQSDGKIIVAGMTIRTDGCERAFVARYRANGALDDSFGVNGRTTIDFSSETGAAGCNGVANAVAVQSDGKIVSAGSASVGGTSTPTVATYIAIARQLGGDAAGNTPTGTNVPVQLNAVTLTFDNVTQGGDTTVTTSLTGPLPPTGFQLGTPATYFDITTTAIFNGGVNVCIGYSGIAFVDEANVRLLHFAATGVVDVTTSVDTVQNVVCGRTATLSPFAVVERVASVAELIVDLIETVKGRALPPALEARLVSVLQTALANPRYVRLTCGVLDLFIRLVQSAAASGQISAARAADLIGQARAIKSALGC